MSAPEQRDILTLAAQFRRAVQDRENVAIQSMIDAYDLVIGKLEGDLDDLLRRIAIEREAGREISRAWLMREERLQTLVNQVEREVSVIAANMHGTITSTQRDLISIGQDQARQLMLAGLGPAPAGVAVSFNRLNVGAVEQMVGFLQDGSPLRALLDELGPDASLRVREALLRGIGTGQHPRTVARLSREAVDGNLARATLISRTEMLRAYRASTQETYKANRDVVQKYIWTAAIGSSRTCMSCVMMHGQVFEVDTIFGSHPACRCAMIPKTVSWEDLGFTDIPDTRPTIEPGRDWFERQPPAKQRELLGVGKYAAYKDGQFDLSQLVHKTTDPAWGIQRSESSLRRMIGAERARLYRGNTPARNNLPLAAAD